MLDEGDSKSQRDWGLPSLSNSCTIDLYLRLWETRLQKCTRRWERTQEEKKTKRVDVSGYEE